MELGMHIGIFYMKKYMPELINKNNLNNNRNEINIIVESIMENTIWKLYEQYDKPNYEELYINTLINPQLIINSNTNSIFGLNNQEKEEDEKINVLKSINEYTTKEKGTLESIIKLNSYDINGVDIIRTSLKPVMEMATEKYNTCFILSSPPEYNITLVLYYIQVVKII